MGRTARGGRMSQVWFGLSCENRTVWAVVPYWFTSVQWTHYHAYWFFSETWWEIYLTITRRWSRMGRWRTGRTVTSIHGMDVTKGDRPFWPRDGHVSVWRTLEGQGDNPGEVHVRHTSPGGCGRPFHSHDYSKSCWTWPWRPACLDTTHGFLWTHPSRTHSVPMVKHTFPNTWHKHSDGYHGDLPA